jgi:predicted transcriptional regulator
MDNELVQHFPSQTAAALWLGISQSAVSNAIRRGSVVRASFRVQTAPR